MTRSFSERVRTPGIASRANAHFLAQGTHRLSGEEGQGLAEYAMILALVAVVAVAALSPLGTGILNVLNSVVGTL